MNHGTQKENICSHVSAEGGRVFSPGRPRPGCEDKSLSGPERGRGSKCRPSGVQEKFTITPRTRTSGAKYFIRLRRKGVNIYQREGFYERI
jgi:hypothetical protein